MSTKNYHRFRHYPGKWSTFDQIEECTKPKWCCGCEFNHAFCAADGRVLEPEKYQDELARERRRYGTR